jgi:hypothetical protein
VGRKTDAPAGVAGGGRAGGYPWLVPKQALVVPRVSSSVYPEATQTGH